MKTLKRHLWRNCDLRDFYDLYNRLYFGGRLPPLTACEFKNLGRYLGHTGRFRQKNRRSKNDTFGIFISKELQVSRRLWAGTMLHEMVHADLETASDGYVGYKTDEGHGTRFQGEICRLWRQGAYDGLL